METNTNIDNRPNEENLKKSVVITLILNFLIVGTGYAYHGRWLLGIIMFFIMIILYLYTFGLALVLFIPIILIHSVYSVNAYNKNLSNNYNKNRFE